MDTDSIDTFAGFLLTRWCKTALVEFRDGGPVAGGGGGG